MYYIYLINKSVILTFLYDIIYLGDTMKVITICGSLKYEADMKLIAEKFALEGNCVLTPVFPVSEDIKISKEQMNYLKEAHFKRIEIADEIYVVNKDGYIGDSTKLEIEYATKLNKVIRYYE